MYDAEISRTHPTAYVFLIDQSASMRDAMATGTSKAQFVSDVINRTLRDLVVRCSREEGIRDYFDIAVIGYGDTSVRNALSGELSHEWLHPISVVADHTLRVEDRPRKVDDGAGGLVTENVKFPIWVDPVANGGTPMQSALATCARIVADWSDAHPDSFPATVLHITDGESTDGSPEHNAGILRSLCTNDGSTLLYNIHVTTQNVTPLRYPTHESALPDEYSRTLFRMSSGFPEHVRRYAAEAHGLTLAPDARAMVLNADAEELVKFLDIGSRPAAMR
jgi:hypothetical protein